MGCGASSAAGDKVAAAATRIDPADEGPNAEKPLKKVSDEAADLEGPEKTPSEHSTASSKVAPAVENSLSDEKLSSALGKSSDSAPAALDTLHQINDAKPHSTERKEIDAKPAAEEAGHQSSVENNHRNPDEKEREETQIENEPLGTPTGDPLLTKRQSLNKLPPLKSPLSAVDPSKDPFAKPVLPTAIPLHSAAPASPSPAATPAGIPSPAVTPGVKTPGSLAETPGSLAGTPKGADSPGPGTPVTNRVLESKPLGPSTLSSGSKAEPEAEVEHTPRTATEAALEALMDDLSVAH